MEKLSIIMPVYNEKKTIAIILDRVRNVRLKNVKKEVIIVDDCSTDSTRDFLRKIKNKDIKVLYHKKNIGKGAAIRTALSHATGSIVLIQDADLEYDPKDYPRLIKPILEGKAKVVYGSRLLGRKSKYSKFAYYAAGKSLTFLSNLLYNAKITDEPCGYKAFRAEVLKGANLKCKRFEFCPEITAKVSKKRIRIYEVSSSYSPRSRDEGKKIRFRDWLEAVFTLIKYRFTN